MTALSAHFTLEEFIKSDTAKARGIKNTPNSVQINTMKHTCEYLLEPLRELLNKYYGVPVSINITSGFRCAQLNIAVGGVDTSEHCNGQAADIEAYKIINGKRVLIDYEELYKLIKAWVTDGKLSVNQCIQERSGSAKWVHVSHSAAGRTKDKREFLKYVNGKYTLDIKL